jgi:hypothetical protein
MALAYYTKIGLTAVQATIVLVSGGQPNVLHFQKQGAYEMARLVALGVQALNLPIALSGHPLVPSVIVPSVTLHRATVSAH